MNVETKKNDFLQCLLDVRFIQFEYCNILIIIIQIGRLQTQISANRIAHNGLNIIQVWRYKKQFWETFTGDTTDKEIIKVK